MSSKKQLEIISFNDLVQRRWQQHSDAGKTEENLVQSEIQNQVHDIFTNGMMDGVPKHLFNDYSKMFGLLLGWDQGSGSTSLVALFQEYYGVKLQLFIWSTFFMVWFLVGKLLPGGANGGADEFMEVNREKLLIQAGFLLLLVAMVVGVCRFVLLPLVEKDMSKYIWKNRKSKELGDIKNYYANNNSGDKKENNFFLAMDGDEIVGHVALDRWNYPGDKVEDLEFNSEYEKQAVKMIEIRRMSVKLSYRGGGVATALLKHVFEYARNVQMDRIILKTSSLQYAARKLYTKLGFKLLGTTQLIPPVAIFKFMLNVNDIKKH